MPELEVRGDGHLTLDYGSSLRRKGTPGRALPAAAGSGRAVVRKGERTGDGARCRAGLKTRLENRKTKIEKRACGTITEVREKRENPVLGKGQTMTIWQALS